jgi:hypothetical protein
MAFGDTLERSEPEGESVSISLSEVENLMSENKSVLTKNNAPEKFVSVTNIFGPVVSNQAAKEIHQRKNRSPVKMDMEKRNFGATLSASKSKFNANR